MTKQTCIAVIDPFPTISNAETEVIKRLEVAARRIGVECVVIEPNGCLRGTKLKLEERYKYDDILFVLSLHFIAPKITKHFTYHAAWNPPEFLGFAWEYNFSVENMLTCDDFLTYDSPGINMHLESLLAPFGRSLDGTSHLATGCAGDVYDPDALRIKNGKMFYCGMNWERLGGKGRHHEIFRILDQYPDRISFYGPQKFQGIAPWGGYKCYAEEIPFDGVSMVKKIQECGIALVLSAEAHRESEAASSRVFESCAAGAFIISDDNPFLLRTFGDAIYQVPYKTSKPQETADAILEAIRWARSHPDEAAAMAKRCQEIYIKHYTYEGQLTEIIARHPLRRQALGICSGASLSVIVAYAESNKDGLRKSLESLTRQLHQPESIIITCPHLLISEVRAILNTHDLPQARIATLPENFKRTNFYMPINVPSTGDLLISILPDIKSEYLSLILAGQEWSDIHAGACLTHLKSTGADLLVSGAMREIPGEDGKVATVSREFLYFAPNRLEELVTSQTQPILAAAMFKTSLIRGLHSANLKFMEGNWLSSLLLLYALCIGKVIFSGRLTAWQDSCLHKQESKTLNRLRTWQVWHIHDTMRNITAWPILRGRLMTMQKDPLPLSRRVINVVKQVLSPFPPLYNGAAKILVLYRQVRIAHTR